MQNMSERRTGTVTFLFTDVEGSTELLKRLGRKRYGELLHEQQRLLRDLFTANHGEEIDTQGDSFFVAFRSASEAVAASVAIQRALAAHQWPDDADVRVRIGIHTGEADAAGERYVGFSVHRAARIGGAAYGGQILLSSSTRELVEDDLPPQVFLRDLGLFRLKDVDRPERISQVAAEGLPSEFPPLRGAEPVKDAVLRRRSVLGPALVGVIAATVAIPVFALSSRGPGLTKSTASSGSNAVSAVDMSNGHPSGSVKLASSPSGIAYGAGSVWVTSPDQDSVSRLDPRSETLQQTIGVGDDPAGIAYGDGFVWVANSLSNTVSQIDPQKNGGQQVAKIDVGNGPTGVAYGLGSVWVANAVDRTITRIDPLSGVRGKPIAVPAGADALSVGDGAVWVTSISAGVLTRVDPNSGTADPINVGNGPSALAVGPRGVWVANSGDATVSRIDPTTNRVTETVTVGEGPNGVALESDGGVWVSSELDGTLQEVDPSAAKVVDNVEVGDRPQGVAMGHGTAYVARKGTNAQHRGGTLTLAVANLPGVYELPIPTSLDPASGYSAGELLTMTNDGLLGYSQAGGAEAYKVVPDLATGLPTVSDGGLTYAFQLRKGIRYSTGGVVQPADIRRGIERALLESAGQTPGSYLAVIRGAGGCLTGKHCDLTSGITTSPGSSTVTFHLSKPDPDFLFQLALPDYDAVPASTPLRARLPLPATGPYKISGYQKKGVVELVRNPRFHVWSTAAQPDGYPDKIVERYRYTGEQAIHAVERGRADVTAEGLDQTWPPALAASLQTRYSSQLYPEPTLYHLGLWLNTRLAPFNDVRVRQALNLAVDRDRLARINAGEVACQYLPPNVNGYSYYCPYNGPDLVKARKLVAESGTKGQPVTIWLPDIPAGHQNSAYLVSVLRSIGYKARVEFFPHDGRTSWRRDRQAGVGGPYWIPDYPSANNVLVSFLCSSYTTDPATNQNPAGSATGSWTRRSRVHGRSRRPTPPPRPAPGTASTAC